MLTILAYLLVIVLAQFAFTFGMFIGTLLTLPFNLIADSVSSENTTVSTFRATVVSVIAGIFCSVICIGFAWGIFRLLVGVDSFTLFPFLASVLSMLIPIYNDFNRYRNLQNVKLEAKEELSDKGFEAVSNITAPTMKASGAIVIGEIVEILLGGKIFLFGLK